MDGDPLNKVISLVIAAIVGIVMIVGAFLPIAAQQISWATGSTNGIANIPGLDVLTGGSGMITALLSVVVIMVIVGLIVGVVSYLRSDR